MGMTRAFDYIVIGAGTAGCCIANRLSEDGSKTVCLIEAGPPDSHALIHNSLIPNLFAVWADRNFTTPYAVEKETFTGQRWPSLIRGTMLGGSSSNNAMIHVRGHARDFDNWKRQGNDGWSFEDVLPYFAKSETYDGAASPYRGNSGPVSVRKLPRPTEAANAFLQRAEDLNFDAGADIDLNTPPLEDKAGYYQYTINPDDTRCSSAVAYLHPVVTNRHNLEILTGYRALRLIVRRQRGGGRKVTGVSCLNLRYGIASDLGADGEVILCAGAIGSPHLMMHSGIGPEADLRAVGIKPVHALPVGSNLHDHMILVLRFETRRALPDPMFISEASLFVELKGARTLSREFEITRGGWPTVQYFAHAGIAALKPPTTPENYLVMAPTLVRPRSRGKLSLVSPDPRVAPKISPNYLSSSVDLSILIGSLEFTRELAAGHGLVKQGGYTDLSKAGTSKRERVGFVKQAARGLWHTVGTCKMAPPDDRHAVVDHEMRVYGVDALRVCDASIMPDIVAANTNPATLMIAERAADLIVRGGDWAASLADAVPPTRSGALSKHSDRTIQRRGGVLVAAMRHVERA